MISSCYFVRGHHFTKIYERDFEPFLRTVILSSVPIYKKIFFQEYLKFYLKI